MNENYSQKTLSTSKNLLNIVRCIQPRYKHEYETGKLDICVKATLISIVINKKIIAVY